MLGLKKGTISFIERNEEWDTIAQREIEHLKVLFGPVAKDVQQIGSGCEILAYEIANCKLVYAYFGYCGCCFIL